MTHRPNLTADAPTEVTGRDRRARETLIPTDTEDVFLSVHTYHDKDRKRFGTSLYGVRVRRTDGYTSKLLSLMDGRRLAGVPVARYSDKALDAAHTEALDKVREALTADADAYDGVLAATPVD
jgi:hypothetical protein